MSVETKTSIGQIETSVHVDGIRKRFQIGTMSGDREDLCERRAYFCKVCQVACLNSSGLYQHYKDEEHKKMEDAYYGHIRLNSSSSKNACTFFFTSSETFLPHLILGQKYGKYSYDSLQDYISCLSRKEPLIGLQYIIQLYREVDCEDAFKCSLCKEIGPLYFIIKHIEGIRHRMTYLSCAYKHLFPLYPKRRMSFYDRCWAVREHAINVEIEERAISVIDSKSCNSRIGVKNDFWKYNLKRQEKLDEYKKKLSASEIQKNNILKYMETLVITTPAEFTLVLDLTEELQAAVNVFNQNTKPRQEKSYKREREQSTDPHEGKYSRSDFSRSKKRSIWYEKGSRPSSKDEVRSVSNKYSVTEEGRERKRSRSASKDMLLKVTFSTGSENEAKNENVQEHIDSPTPHPDKEKVGASNNFSETTSSYCEWTNVNTDRVQEIRAKRIRKLSTDVAKWESLFANHRPESSLSAFSCGPKPTPLNEAEVPLSVEKNKNTRRDSLDALSTYTLFSQEEYEHGSAGCPLSSDTLSSLQSPGFKSCQSLGIMGNVFKDRGPHHKLKQFGDKDQELPCTSNTIFNETLDVIVMHTEPEQHADKFKWISHVTKSNQNSEAVSSCNQLFDGIANVTQAPKSSHILDASSEYSEFKACGSRLLETQTDSQDADSNVLGNTSTTGTVHASGRQLSPEVLQLFKGKDANHIVHMLEKLSPFYPALQELDLEVFAEALSKTGAIQSEKP
ncbi:uncharacterized protein [Phyllobates terribilis]|uniref:uncharacterized protein isoform X2 n=1 Tax=Phyllobates terribilis TaxID=111132 RepID=UPI003CCACC13